MRAYSSCIVVPPARFSRPPPAAGKNLLAQNGVALSVYTTRMHTNTPRQLLTRDALNTHHTQTSCVSRRIDTPHCSRHRRDWKMFFWRTHSLTPRRTLQCVRVWTDASTSRRSPLNRQIRDVTQTHTHKCNTQRERESINQQIGDDPHSHGAGAHAQ